MSTSPISTAEAGVPSLNSAADTEPWENWERVRELGDVVWDVGMNAWLVTSHVLLLEIAKGDENVWGSGRADEHRGPRVSVEGWLGFVGYHSQHNLQILTGEEHHEQHRWWM